MFSISGIPAHIDTHSAFEDEIISLSLGSEVSAEAFFFLFVFKSAFSLFYLAQCLVSPCGIIHSNELKFLKGKNFVSMLVPK